MTNIQTLKKTEQLIIKKKKKTFTKKKEEEKIRVLTIDERFNFIKLIIDKKYPISIDDNKNNFIIKNNNFSNFHDIFKYFFKKPNEKKILVDKNGDLSSSYGIPYLLCKGSCNHKTINKNHFKIALKIILFNIGDLETVRNINEVKVFIKKSLTKLYLEKNNKKDYDLSLINKMNEKELYELYGKLDNNLNQNTEIRLIYLLSKLVLQKRTPHINLPILAFQTNINEFLKKKYLTLTEIKNIFYTKESLSNTNLINILISEWCDGGDLESFLIKNKKNFNNNELNLDVLFFQLLSLFTTILIYYPNFKHNDLHLGNLLVKKNKPTNKYYLYKIKNLLENVNYTNDNYTNYIIPDMGFQIRLWDYDLSSIEGLIDNNFINSVFGDDNDTFITSKKNQFEDLVKFSFMYKRDIIDKSIINNNKYNKIILEDILGKLDYNDNNKSLKEKKENKSILNSYGYLLKNVEYTTPLLLLQKYSLNYEYFGKFICQEKDLEKYSIIETYTVD
jgi:hypothetical protein